MGTNQRRLDMLEKRARDTITEVAERDARRIVAIWNGRRAQAANWKARKPRGPLNQSKSE
jgi:hypothetical protein